MNSKLLASQDIARIEVQERQANIKGRFQNERGVISISEDGNIQKFTFSADVLFPTDIAALSPQGDDLLTNFGQVLRDNSSFYTRIEIEGHADLNPSKHFFKSGDYPEDHGNWRLSSERTITVAQLFQELGIPGEQLAVLGRSFYNPVDKDNTEEVLAKNRRIEMRLFYSETAVPGPSEAQRVNPKEAIELAKKYLNSGQYEDAIKKAEELLHLPPDIPEAIEIIPAANEIINRAKEAIEERKEQERINITLNSARASLNAGKYDDAIRKAREVLELDPNNSETKEIIKRAEEIKEAGKTKEMMNIALKPAEDYLNRGKYDDAIEKAKEMLELDPNNSAAKEVIKKAEETKEEIKEGIELARESSDKGQYNEAIKILEELRKKYPENKAISEDIESAQREKEAEEKILQ